MRMDLKELIDFEFEKSQIEFNRNKDNNNISDYGMNFEHIFNSKLCVNEYDSVFNK